MIVWQGFGFVGALIPFAFVLVANFVLDRMFGRGYYSAHTWAPAIALALAAAVVWFVGTWLNSRPGRELVDAHTGERVVFARRHTLFFLPVQYFAIVVGIAALVLPFVR